jgi:tetraprenyl-beta-curcumene synthase
MAIPDPELKRAALLTIERKGGHNDGAAVFAVLLPEKDRPAFVRMATAYGLILDYLDALSEQPVSDPWADTLQLHRAARNAVTLAPGREPDYYMFHPRRDDGGFLSTQVNAFREIFSALPSAAVVSDRAEHLVALYAESRARSNVARTGRGQVGSTTGIDAVAARAAELSWDEVSAACSATTPLFALMVLAALPGTTKAEVDEWLSVYFPWVAPPDARLALRARAQLARLPQPYLHQAIARRAMATAHPTATS